jgi:transposase InsO family protein
MAFVAVLSWSRRIFLRFSLDARMESFLRGHVQAFEAWSGFHSDNGSVDLGFCQYINHKVAKMLEKLRIEQTKSRSRNSNDNALAESKNASVVRKHMGNSPIPQKYAKPINAFYQEVFNDWLNMHRPCLFATEVVSDKGKIKKVYKHKDARPH